MSKARDGLYDGLMGKPSIETEGCAFCKRYPVERHHIVPRSHGGKNGPTVTVCGFGNTSGCHGKLHSHRLHLRWNEGWEYLETKEPTKEMEALDMDGWTRLGGRGFYA